MKYLWKGPYEDGISQSLMQDFYICKYRFFLKYILGIEEDGPVNANLAWGDSFHKGLEHLIRGDSLADSTEVMLEYLNKHYSLYVLGTYPHSLSNMLSLYRLDQFEQYRSDDVEIITEHKINDLIDYNGYTYRARGKIDVLIPGIKIIDHKCKDSRYYTPDETREELPTDLQMAYYSKLVGVTEYGYDLIRIPETDWKLPPKRGAEQYDQYVNRLFNGTFNGNLDYPIGFKKHRWIAYLSYPNTQEAIDEVWNKTVYPTWEALREFYEYVTDPSFDYLNPKCYNSTFYQTPVRHFNPILTSKFKGEFHDLLIGKKTLDDYIQKETCFPELKEE